MSAATAEITNRVSFPTDSYDRDSVQASQREPVSDLYKLGFIIASICGGLLFILTLYCLITHKVSELLFLYLLFLIYKITCALVKLARHSSHIANE